jgi:hypothetical protein
MEIDMNAVLFTRPKAVHWSRVGRPFHKSAQTVALETGNPLFLAYQGACHG